MRTEKKLLKELRVAEKKAWDSLGRYKFQMFGYWAAIWVHLNRIGGFKRPNPWRVLVAHARDKHRRDGVWVCDRRKGTVSCPI